MTAKLDGKTVTKGKRKGKTRGAVRASKPTDSLKGRYSVSLTTIQASKLESIGGGSLSKGVHKLISRFLARKG